MDPGQNLIPEEQGYEKSIKSTFYWTFYLLYYSHKPKGRLMTMYTMRYVFGHIQVYDMNGRFLFSADNEREVREELEEYAESAA